VRAGVIATLRLGLLVRNPISSEIRQNKSILPANVEADSSQDQPTRSASRPNKKKASSLDPSAVVEALSWVVFSKR
jgi:hypothetical protein